MKIRSAINGIHSFSDSLIQEVLNYKYGRSHDRKALQARFLIDVEELIALQEELNYPVIHTGSLAMEDLLRPFTIALDSFHSFNDIGELPIRRWSTTNFFYREPQLVNKLPEEPFVLRESKNELFASTYFLTEYCKTSKKKYRIQIPGVMTFAFMTDFRNALLNGVYKDIHSYYHAIGEYLGQELRTLPPSCSEIQMDEPMLLWKELPRSHEQSIFAAYKTIRSLNPAKTLIVNTFFADARKKLRFILDLPVNGLGIDLCFTNPSNIVKHDFKEKILQIGLLNAKNYLFPNEHRRKVMKKYWQSLITGLRGTDIQELIITPNTGLHYLPRREADEMLVFLENTVSEVRNEK